jgi:hypothetical protein
MATDQRSADDKATLAYHKMCAAVGHAISCWSDVESELANLFAISLRSRDFGVAIEAFYCAIGFDTKLRLANTAIRANCIKRPDALTQWGTLHNRLKRKGESRNKLAHGKVITHIETKDGERIFHGCWFIPYFGFFREQQGFGSAIESRSNASIRIEKMKVTDLHQVADGYVTLANQLKSFIHPAILATRDHQKSKRITSS